MNIEKKKIAEIIETQREELKTERDGIGGLAILENGEIKIERHMTDYNGVIDWAVDISEQARLVSLHTRTGTSGERTLNNVHFFEDRNYLAAHNGFVSDYHTSYNLGFRMGESYADYERAIIDDEMPDIAREDCTGCYTSKAGICKRHKWANERSILTSGKRKISKQCFSSNV